MTKKNIKKGNCILLVGIILGICITLFIIIGVICIRYIDIRDYIDNRDYMVSYGLGLGKELSQIYSNNLSEEQINNAQKKIEQCILQQGWSHMDVRSAVDGVYEYILALEYDDNQHRKTAYETIYYETGDCLGKADLFCKFMEYLGIEAFIIPIYLDAPIIVLQMLPKDIWEAYSKTGHAINGVIIEDECYLIDCCKGEFMFQGIYGEEGVARERLVTMYEFNFTKQSNVEYVVGDDLYHFKYRIMPQIEEEIVMLLQEKCSGYEENGDM